MTRELILLRHGKSDWNVEVDDFQRPLKNRGKRGAQMLGVWLNQQNLVPDYVISSPAVRALSTAQRVCKVIEFNKHDIKIDQKLYLATPEELVEVIKTCPPNAKRLMLVGHNPGMEDLIISLANQQLKIPEDGKILPTATLAVFKIKDNWHEFTICQAKLVDLIRARDLSDKMAFSDFNSNKSHKRAAYNYVQSSVIPYRLNDGGVEVLIVGSSNGKHWIFPKGINVPILSPQESAANEAFEEAGVKGVVGNKPLGEYSSNKWGGSCRVTVYSMEVTRIVPESEWQENHRGRKWLPIEEVPNYIGNNELLTMLGILSKKLQPVKQ